MSRCVSQVCLHRALRESGHLGIQGEGLGEPEGVRVVFVVIAKLLTLNTNTGINCFLFGSIVALTLQVCSPTSLISCLSNHLSTSGPSSVSARYTANLAMRMAAASWSKDAAML